MIKPSNTIEYLGHIFLLQKSKYVSNDYICNNCNHRIHINNNQNILEVINYIDEINNGGVRLDGKTYELTCEEQIIKNLLE